MLTIFGSEQPELITMITRRRTRTATAMSAIRQPYK